MKHPKDDFITYMAAVTDRSKARNAWVRHMSIGVHSTVSMSLWKESIYRSRTSPPCGYRLSKTTC